MHKRDWLFYGHLHRHLVTLFHFEKTGRVMVYLNHRLLLEEMLPTPSSSYTYQFFVDDELCEMELTYGAQKRFAYDFRSPNYSTSRYGRWQQWKDRLDILKGVSLFVLLGLLILLPVVYYFWQQGQAEQDFRVGMMTQGTVVALEPTFNNNGSASAVASYVFDSDTKAYVGKQVLEYNAQKKTYSTPEGLPIRGGERFMVLFQPSNPNHSRMDWTKPTVDQIAAYQTDVRETCVVRFANMPIDKAMMYCDCLSRFLVEQEGIDALVRLYHSNTQAADNSVYNRNTFVEYLMQHKDAITACEKLQ